MSKEVEDKNLNKYNNKEAVFTKWVNLNKRLNKNKDSNYYSRTIIDAQSLTEYVINNVIKDSEGNIPKKDERGRFYGLMEKLMLTKQKGRIFPNELVDRLRRIKNYRNLVAHNTETTVKEMIDYNKTEEALEVYGEVLCCLGFLDRENIVIPIDKLKAQVNDLVDEVVFLKEFIGEGASGRVFKGYHKRLGIEVAIKEIKHNIVEAEIIENEKRILVSLKHSGIPNIYDVIGENRTYYIVMEYVNGITLEESIKTTGPLSLKALIDIGEKLCDIISYLHSSEVIYNDLKPSNILIDSYNNISLIDFGISSDINNKVKSTSTYSGTYVYSSPEQLRGEIGSISNDVYSLGANLYYLSEGEHPIVCEEQRFKKSTDERIKYIIEKAMNYNINNRYNDVNNLKEDLIKVGNGKTPMGWEKDKNKRKGIITLSCIILGILLLSGASFGIYKLLSTEKNQVVSTNVESETNKGVSSEVLNDKSNNSVTSENSQNTGGVNVNNIGSTFNGQLTVNLVKYEVIGKDIKVSVSVQNKYEKEISFWSDGIYIMNENGKKFGIDTYKQLENGGTKFSVVPGENKDFIFYLTDYTESSSLTFKLDKIWCMGSESMKNTIEIKIK